jgi:hypothetical protein
MGRGKTSGWNSYEPHTVDCTGCFTTWCTTYVAVQRELGLLSERRAGNGSDHSVDNGIARKSLSTAMAASSIKLLFFSMAGPRCRSGSCMRAQIEEVSRNEKFTTTR